MAHVDPEVIALIALGEDAGTPDDRAHLADCESCQAELRRLAETVTVARQGGAGDLLVSPPPELWSRIAADADVASVDGASTAGDGGSAVPPGDAPARRRRRRWPVLTGRPAVAALCLVAGVIIALAGVAIFRGEQHVLPARVVGRISLHPLPQFPQWQSARGTAVMESDPAGLRLQVRVRAPARQGFLEVWLLARNGVSMISLGDLGRGQSGEFDVPPGVDLRNYSRIDVSLQQFNGSTAHSKISVLRGRLSG